jgi:hypothetical protein
LDAKQGALAHTVPNGAPSGFADEQWPAFIVSKALIREVEEILLGDQNPPTTASNPRGLEGLINEKYPEF